MQMHFHRKLPNSQEVKEQYPLTKRMIQVKAGMHIAAQQGYKGIVAIRDLHLTALRDYDFSCADTL